MVIEIPLNDQQHKVLLHLVAKEDLTAVLNKDKANTPLINNLIEWTERVAATYSDLTILVGALGEYGETESNDDIRREIHSIQNIIHDLYIRTIFGTAVLKSLHEGNVLQCVDLQIKIVDNELRMMDGMGFGKKCVLSVNKILEKTWKIVQ